MNKNVIIAALAALLIGIGIGFTMAQVNKADAPQMQNAEVTTSAETSTSANAEASTETASSQEASNSQSASAQASTSQESLDTQDTQESSASEPEPSPATQTSSVQVAENGTYTSKDEVAAYIHAYGHLPSNYISKTKAKKAGWVSSKGNLDDVLPGMSIGGSEFYNDEGQLPDAPGRTWTECDINYEGGYRGAERIVFSNDGLIFYTSDHYKTFEQLY